MAKKISCTDPKVEYDYLVGFSATLLKSLKEYFMTKIHELAELGQAIWLDYIRRSFITSGELQRLIDLGLRGMTSNPSIFDKAIAQSRDYDEDLLPLINEEKAEEEIFLALAIEDIQQAADLFLPLYQQTRGEDGYVSLEVNPKLAHDTQATIEEAQRLWSLVDRPNLMVKIPATKEGLPAITETLRQGINVNVTLIFSLQRYAEVMAAYIAGLRDRLDAGQSLEQIASVASFFVSRVDTKVDKQLEDIIRQEGQQARLAASLLGKAAIANAKIAHSQFRSVFEGKGFADLKNHGARLQRPLWASTSTKNPQYSDILYVQELIAPHTVNTVPQETLEFFVDHGEVRLTLEDDLDQARIALQSLADLGISMDQVTQELEDEGVAAFAKSFESLMGSIKEKREQLHTANPNPSGNHINTPVNHSLRSFNLGPSQEKVDAALDEMSADHILERIWDHDYTVWKPEPHEIANRLGWLKIAEAMKPEIQRIEAFVQDVRQAGYTHALLLGMGGSSLAPELFSRTFSGAKDSLNLEVLDSTDPGVVLGYAGRLDPDRTLFVVSTKSGTTEETLSFFKFFYNWVLQSLGAEQTGRHFIAITDPGSKLAALAERYQFRDVFLNDPNIGGRYSVLSFFGLLPAALCGVDLSRLVDNAIEMARACHGNVPVYENPAARLGAILAENTKAGVDKVTFVLSPAIQSFGDWVEQLIAESIGKEGKGILPVVGEPLGAPAVYGNDRLFVNLQLEGDGTYQTELSNLQDSSFPLVQMDLQAPYDLGGQFFLWELATAVAGYRLGINPFDQPDVEFAKVRARELVAQFKQTGRLPEDTPILSKDGIAVYGPERVVGAGSEWNLEADTPGEALASFLSQARTSDYIALQAFIQPTQETDAALHHLRRQLRDRYRLATSLGYGPRFLHSTGQLHKGDAGKGLFIQFTAENLRDIPIPDTAGEPGSSISFGVLELAQALGDRQALLDAGRRVIRFHLLSNIPESIQRLARIFD